MQSFEVKDYGKGSDLLNDVVGTRQQPSEMNPATRLGTKSADQFLIPSITPEMGIVITCTRNAPEIALAYNTVHEAFIPCPGSEAIVSWRKAP